MPVAVPSSLNVNGVNVYAFILKPTSQAVRKRIIERLCLPAGVITGKALAQLYHIVKVFRKEMFSKSRVESAVFYNQYPISHPARERF